MAEKSLQILIKAKDEASAAFKNLKNAVEDFEKGADSATKTNKSFGVSFAGLKDAASAVISVFGTIGGAVAVGIGDALTTFATFDDTMRAVGAVAGATGEELAQLTALAQDMGAKTRYSASEAGEGLQFLAMAGLDVKQQMAALPDVLNLAAANQMDLGEAANITTNVLSAMGLQSKDTAVLMKNLASTNDFLTKTAQSANTNVTELGAAIRVAGPAAKGSNESLKDMLSVLGVLANNAFTAENAGQAYKRMVTELQVPTSQATAKLKELNITTTDSSGKFRGVIPIMKDLGKANLDLADATAIFGKETGSVALAVTNNTAMLDEMDGKLTNITGTTKNTSEKMEDGLGGAFRSLNSAWEGLKITLGEGLGPAAVDAVEVLKTAINITRDAVKGWSQDGSLKEIGSTIVDIFKWLTDWQVPMASIDRAVVELHKNWLQLKSVWTFGDDQKALDDQISALERRDVVIQQTITDVYKEQEAAKQSQLLTTESARASIKAAQDVKKAIDDIPKEQSVKHKTEFTGTGSDEKPITEKIAEISTVMDGLRTDLAEGETNVTAFEGNTGDGDVPITEAVKNAVGYVQLLGKEVEKPAKMQVEMPEWAKVWDEATRNLQLHIEQQKQLNAEAAVAFKQMEDGLLDDLRANAEKKRTINKNALDAIKDYETKHIEGVITLSKKEAEEKIKVLSIGTKAQSDALDISLSLIDKQQQQGILSFEQAEQAKTKAVSDNNSDRIALYKEYIKELELSGIGVDTKEYQKALKEIVKLEKDTNDQILQFSKERLKAVSNDMKAETGLRDAEIKLSQAKTEEFFNAGVISFEEAEYKKTKAVVDGNRERLADYQSYLGQIADAGFGPDTTEYKEALVDVKNAEADLKESESGLIAVQKEFENALNSTDAGLRQTAESQGKLKENTDETTEALKAQADAAEEAAEATEKASKKMGSMSVSSSEVAYGAQGAWQAVNGTLDELQDNLKKTATEAQRTAGTSPFYSWQMGDAAKAMRDIEEGFGKISFAARSLGVELDLQNKTLGEAQSALADSLSQYEANIESKVSIKRSEVEQLNALDEQAALQGEISHVEANQRIADRDRELTDYQISLKQEYLGKVDEFERKAADAGVEIRGASEEQINAEIAKLRTEHVQNVIALEQDAADKQNEIGEGRSEQSAELLKKDMEGFKAFLDEKVTADGIATEKMIDGGWEYVERYSDMLAERVTDNKAALDMEFAAVELSLAKKEITEEEAAQRKYEIEKEFLEKKIELNQQLSSTWAEESAEYKGFVTEKLNAEIELANLKVAITTEAALASSTIEITAAEETKKALKEVEEEGKKGSAAGGRAFSMGVDAIRKIGDGMTKVNESIEKSSEKAKQSLKDLGKISPSSDKSTTINVEKITGLDKLKNIKLEVEVKVDKESLIKEIKEALRREGLVGNN